MKIILYGVNFIIYLVVVTEKNSTSFPHFSFTVIVITLALSWEETNICMYKRVGHWALTTKVEKAVINALDNEWCKYNLWKSLQI